MRVSGSAGDDPPPEPEHATAASDVAPRSAIDRVAKGFESVGMVGGIQETPATTRATVAPATPEVEGCVFARRFAVEPRGSPDGVT
jgi:hypothetical protein